MENLVKWTIDYDLSPEHCDAMPDLFTILRGLVPSEKWDGIENTLKAKCNNTLKAE
jgi:hypothetical protein